MLKTPLVSFVVTSYNYEKFVIKTLESIKEQTYKNFEIIVVDDFSSDKSVERIEEFIALNQDIRITLIKHENNKGQLAAMLTGLKVIQGQFVAFIDSDDVLVKEYAAAHLRVHLSTSVAFTSSRIIEIDENDEIHTINSISSPGLTGMPTVTTLEELLNVEVDNIEYKVLSKKHFGGWYWSPNSSAMYRKSAIDILLKYRHVEKWRICPDKFLFNIANLIGGSALIYSPLVGYRRHRSNAGGSSYVCGDTRYISDRATVVNLSNNIKIKPEGIKFLFENKSDFTAKFGTRGFLKLLLRIIF